MRGKARGRVGDDSSRKTKLTVSYRADGRYQSREFDTTRRESRGWGAKDESVHIGVPSLLQDCAVICSLILSGRSVLSLVTQTQLLPTFSQATLSFCKGISTRAAICKRNNHCADSNSLTTSLYNTPLPELARISANNSLQPQCHPKQPPKHRGQVQRKVPKRGRQQQPALAPHASQPGEQRGQSTQLERGHQTFNVRLYDNHRAVPLPRSLTSKSIPQSP